MTGEIMTDYRDWRVAMWYTRYRKDADGKVDRLGLLRGC